MPRAKSKHLERGVLGEDIAVSHLQDKGFALCERNWSCKLGEVDAIMETDGELVFVEVRLRKQTSYGTGYETVAWQKQRKLARTAQLYIQHHKLFHKAARFDVVSITELPSGEFEVDHIPHAFGV